MIKVNNITKEYQNQPILKGVSLEINQSDYIAIMGPSGSGKSTLLYCVSGMDTINQGNVTFFNQDITAMKEDELSLFRLHKMGFVFQYSQMLKNLTIYDNIILPGLVAKKETPEVIHNRADKLMNRMEITQIKDRDLREVSGGQLQRASICRAMINHPDILFMDEPTGALNSEATEQVLSILDDLNQEGVTMMLVTHDPKVASRAKKVIYIRDGQIVDTLSVNPNQNREDQLSIWLKTLKL